ncbi:hypothetical protein GYH30_006500 [Glycine max]|nr:hypothetical protein GYH30_006500 [Glycine max]
MALSSPPPFMFFLLLLALFAATTSCLTCTTQKLINFNNKLFSNYLDLPLLDSFLWSTGPTTPSMPPPRWPWWWWRPISVAGCIGGSTPPTLTW